MITLKEALQRKIRAEAVTPGVQYIVIEPPMEFIDTTIDEAILHIGGPSKKDKGWLHTDKTKSAMQVLLNYEVAKEFIVPSFLGKGIVISGGGTYFPLAYTAIFNLRKLGCTLPIELWYIGDRELNAEQRTIVEKLNVVTRDCNHHGSSRILAGWESKPHSIIYSSFEEVLYLDADNLAARDPTYLFDDAEYKRTGARFWPDLQTGRIWIPDGVWEIAGIKNKDKPAFESGQILINKSKCWRELHITAHLNNYSDCWYEYVYGDKDTFKLAWHKCETEYVIGEHSGWINPAIHQYDANNQILFFHCVQGKKHIENGIPMVGLTAEVNKNVYEAKKELRGIWSEITPLISKSQLEAKSKARVMDIITEDGSILTKCLGKYSIYCDPQDISITPHLQKEGFWESWVTIALQRLVQPGWKCVNVGANYGYYSCIMADLSGEVVHAFEPVPKIAALLRKTAKQNNLNIIVHEEACWSEECEKEIFYDNQYLCNPSLVRDNAIKETVKCTTLDNSVEHADLIFIDAEGAENHILNGAKRLMAQGSRFIVEVNPQREYDPEWLDTLRLIYPFRYIDNEGGISPITNIDREVMLYLAND